MIQFTEMKELVVIGGGLAGSEAAWQAAQRGVKVVLFEMRPEVMTAAHSGGNLAELVCSNSLGSSLVDRAPGLLKEEIRRLGSLLINCADETAVPAGGALAVDREAFSQRVSTMLADHPNIQVVREEVLQIPDGTAVIASGPMTSDRLAQSIARLTGHEGLYFYDALAPIVTQDSINYKIAFRASRYQRGILAEGDYINCPMTRDEYCVFIEALINSERIKLHDFELDLDIGVRAGAQNYFEGCLPIEVLAQRGRDALAFGPLRPVGLIDPRSGRRPYAVVQLRQDNLAGTLYNMVGFQTNLKFTEQERIFRMIPGLEQADFVRHGQMHRNTFINSPGLLFSTLQYRKRTDLFFAGQITGVEGYVGNIATGFLAGWNAARILFNKEALALPVTTMLGSLCHYITHASAADFQPMKANFGLLPELDISGIHGKRQRGQAHSQRAFRDLETFLYEIKNEESY